VAAVLIGAVRRRTGSKPRSPSRRGGPCAHQGVENVIGASGRVDPFPGGHGDLGGVQTLGGERSPPLPIAVPVPLVEWIRA